MQQVKAAGVSHEDYSIVAPRRAGKSKQTEMVWQWLITTS